MASRQQQQQQQQRKEPSSCLRCSKILHHAAAISGREGMNENEFVEFSPAWEVSWSRDGKVLASCHGAPHPSVRLWKRQRRGAASSASLEEEEEKGTKKSEDDWMLIATLDGVHTRTVRSVSFSPSGRVLATASFDGTVGIWENLSPNDTTTTTADTGKDGMFKHQQQQQQQWECTAQLEGHDNEVKCVRFNDTGTLLATCGRDKSVWIWECLLPGSIGGPQSISDFDHHSHHYPQTAVVASSVGGGDSEGEFDCIAVLHGHAADVKCVEFAPSHGQWGDGDEILLSASYDDTIKCWAEDDGDWYCASTLKAHTSTVWSISIAPGGIRLISGSADGSLGIWKCYSAIERQQRKQSLDPEEKEGGAALWKCVGKLPSAHDREVFSVHCAPMRAGHDLIASAGGDNRIQIYRQVFHATMDDNNNNDAPLFVLDGIVSSAHDDGDVNSVQWHPRDGTLLASAGDDGLVRLWRYDNAFMD